MQKYCSARHLPEEGEEGREGIIITTLPWPELMLGITQTGLIAEQNSTEEIQMRTVSSFQSSR